MYHGWFIGLSMALLALLLMLFFLLRYQFFFLPFTALKIKAYEKIFFQHKTLADFPETPKAAINATNLETGTLMTFSRSRISDSSYDNPKDKGAPIKFLPDQFPLAMAVASSTCVPFAFPPVSIEPRYFADANDVHRASPRLSDGGLYDNQGIHKLTQPKSSYRCNIVIISDGSEPFSFRFKGKNSGSVMYRSNDIMMRRIKTLQFIRDVYGQQLEIAYFSLDWQYEACIGGFINAMKEKIISNELLDHHKIPIEIRENPAVYYQQIMDALKQSVNFTQITENGLSVDEIKVISKIGTGLSAFKKDRISLIARHASVLTELQVKIYCPSLTPKPYAI
jgi:NTE family protein